MASAETAAAARATATNAPAAAHRRPGRGRRARAVWVGTGSSVPYRARGAVLLWLLVQIALSVLIAAPLVYAGARAVSRRL
ncbi:MAG TPA: hypothetical protein VFN47_05960 [Pedococcus sp.]|nr:hypothetical protein [Pedococcus sp.]